MPQSRLKKILIRTPRPLKQAIVVTLDLLLLLLSSILVLDLRMEGFTPFNADDAWLFGVGVVLALPIFTTMGLYRAIFRYAGLQVVFALNKALALYTGLYVLVFTVVGVSGVPRSLGLAQPMLFAFLVMSSRLFARHWLGGMGLKAKLKLAKPVLIYGAGSAGRQLANSIYQSQELVAVGYVDDDDRLHGHILNGVPIFSPQDLAQVVADKQVAEIYLALPSVPRKRRNEIIDMLKPLPLKVLTLPGLMDLTSGKVAIADLKDLDVEDLLGREPVPPNPLLLAKNITGKVVMVTGAGGSIGSELCRQILKLQPATLLLVELTEFALYQIEQELRVEQAQLPEPRTQIVPLLANVYPNGSADVNQFQAAGGPAYVIGQLLAGGFMHPDVLTVRQGGLHEYTCVPTLKGDTLTWVEPGASKDTSIVRPHTAPFSASGGLKLLTGNLGRSVIKVSAVPEDRHIIEAPCRVFDSQEALHKAFSANELNHDVVCVVR